MSLSYKGETLKEELYYQQQFQPLAKMLDSAANALGTRHAFICHAAVCYVQGFIGACMAHNLELNYEPSENLHSVLSEASVELAKGAALINTESWAEARLRMVQASVILARLEQQRGNQPRPVGPN